MCDHCALATVVAADGEHASEGEEEADDEEDGVVGEYGFAEDDGAGRKGEDCKYGVVCTHDGAGAESFEGEAQIHHLKCHRRYCGGDEYVGQPTDRWSCEHGGAVVGDGVA